MDDKYFIPDVDDFHVGYEYEMYDGYSWTKQVFPNPWWFNAGGMGTLPVLTNSLASGIRVSYLTKEKLEEEAGRTLHEEEGTIIGIDKNEIILFYSIPKRQLEVISEEGFRYSGNCRCINDFRWIMKRLKSNIAR